MANDSEYWVPGAKAIINGVPCICVRAREIPEEVWEHLRKTFYNSGLPNSALSLWCVGMQYEPGGPYYKVDVLPVYWNEGGSCYYSTRLDSGKTAYVPESFIKPQENEFGPVSP